MGICLADGQKTHLPGSKKFHAFSLQLSDEEKIYIIIAHLENICNF
jgi:hypothetical protein